MKIIQIITYTVISAILVVIANGKVLAFQFFSDRNSWEAARDILSFYFLLLLCCISLCLVTLL
ncbi:MAG: hypothetical protein SAK29_19545 [Scytonema sp. PMC 1069.18]|nr:hypothetical protein [Scytonema sp. PMC 1069.18]MEC4882043.1 hypothetical protein [Scytonema sp. PMC 1070.18]